MNSIYIVFSNKMILFFKTSIPTTTVPICWSNSAKMNYPSNLKCNIRHKNIQTVVHLNDRPIGKKFFIVIKWSHFWNQEVKLNLNITMYLTGKKEKYPFRKRNNSKGTGSLPRYQDKGKNNTWPFSNKKISKIKKK